MFSPQLANFITISRIVGIAAILWFTPYSTANVATWIITVYTLICLTDFLDGWIARKLNIVTDLGKILDPLADKILVLVFLPLLQMHAITAFPVFVILTREFSIMALRVLSAKQGTVVGAQLSGKVKTAITLPVCGILLARVPVADSRVAWFLKPVDLLRDWVFHWPQWVFHFLIAVMVVVTVWSFFDYLGSFLWQLSLQRAGNDRQKAKRFLLAFIPNAITLLNLSVGILSCVLALKGDYLKSAGLVLVGVFLDALDGMLARKLQVESPLGAKLDSRADFITFGIAPALLIWQYFSDFSLAYSGFIGAALGLWHYGTVHYRLRRFNRTGHSDFFEGIPSPVGASLSSVGLVFLGSCVTFWVAPLIIVTGALMISKIPYIHSGASQRDLILRLLRYPTLVSMIIATGELLSGYQESIGVVALLALIGVYVLSPIWVKRT